MFALRIDDDLSVRLLEQRHAPMLFALIDANRDHLGRWFPWVARTTSAEHSLDFIRRSLRKFADGNGFEAAIYSRGEHVGMIGLHYIDWNAGRTELGYWLAHTAQGRGIMTRVVQGISGVVFESYGLQRVEIRCHPDNVRSRAVPERLGFTHEGTLRRVAAMGDELFDHVVYGLLESEWKPTGGQPAGDRQASSSPTSTPTGSAPGASPRSSAPANSPAGSAPSDSPSDSPRNRETT